MKFSPIKLLILFAVYGLEKAKIKEVAQEVERNRRTVSTELTELTEVDKLIGCVEDISKYQNIYPTKTYYLLDELTKRIFDCVTKAINSIKLNNHEKNGALSKGSVNLDLINADTTESTDGKAGECTALMLWELQQVYKSLEKEPLIAQTIFHLLGDTGQSIKQVSEQTKWPKTTVRKYLKHFLDLGIAYREIGVSHGVGRGEYLYFLAPKLSRAISEVKKETKNRHSTLTSPTQPELGDNNHVSADKPAVCSSNIQISDISERINMNTESFQPQSASESVDKNGAEGFDPLAYKIKEFIRLTDQIERIEQELRDLLGPGKETEIAITRLKFKKI
ncbi:hypothetical protein [Nostoc sp.]|uniref:hypothetical protein n=1 Tax=Nostoc sp. TaxID=1180 RepID=UPI002FEFB743